MVNPTIIEDATLYRGDCLEVMARLAGEGVTVDAIVTDPPYEIGFMGKKWDGGGVAFQPETWRLCLDLLKPGGHMLVFGIPRAHHRMICAVEDAGFEIRDCILWLFGSGFPKSHDVSKAIDRAAGHWRGRAGDVKSTNASMENPNYERTDKGDPITDVARQWQGWGTALKPACEFICLARKPLVGTVAENVQAHGTGALNIDASRVDGIKPQVTQGINSNATSFNVAKTRQLSDEPHVGRWPANLCHDGSEEVLEAFARFGEKMSASSRSRPPHNATSYHISDEIGKRSCQFAGETGTAARFFYHAKADKADRLGSKHPTVKPVDLMAWLVRLVTPPGGLVLDPFAGSGTTGSACLREGLKCILIEREAEYVADIERRLGHVQGADTPLFATS
jgi:DNA modification methylase